MWKIAPTNDPLELDSIAAEKKLVQELLLLPDLFPVEATFLGAIGYTPPPRLATFGAPRLALAKTRMDLLSMTFGIDPETDGRLIRLLGVEIYGTEGLVGLQQVWDWWYQHSSEQLPGGHAFSSSFHKLLSASLGRGSDRMQMCIRNVVGAANSAKPGETLELALKLLTRSRGLVPGDAMYEPTLLAFRTRHRHWSSGGAAFEDSIWARMRQLPTEDVPRYPPTNVARVSISGEPLNSYELLRRIGLRVLSELAIAPEDAKLSHPSDAPLRKKANELHVRQALGEATEDYTRAPKWLEQIEDRVYALRACISHAVCNNGFRPTLVEVGVNEVAMPGSAFEPLMPRSGSAHTDEQDALVEAALLKLHAFYASCVKRMVEDDTCTAAMAMAAVASAAS